MTYTEVLNGLRKRTKKEFLTANEVTKLIGISKNQGTEFVKGLKSMSAGGRGIRKTYHLSDIAQRCLEYADGLYAEEAPDQRTKTNKAI